MKVFCLLMALVVGVGAAPKSEELSWGNFLEWGEYVKPGGDDLAWEEISWRNKFMPAVGEAQVLNRPVLLWAMNGNPCGQT